MVRMVRKIRVMETLEKSGLRNYVKVRLDVQMGED